jgi:hypothetical protein
MSGVSRRGPVAGPKCLVHLPSAAGPVLGFTECLISFCRVGAAQDFGCQGGGTRTYSNAEYAQATQEAVDSSRPARYAQVSATILVRGIKTDGVTDQTEWELGQRIVIFGTTARNSPGCCRPSRSQPSPTGSRLGCPVGGSQTGRPRGDTPGSTPAALPASTAATRTDAAGRRREPIGGGSVQLPSKWSG